MAEHLIPTAARILGVQEEAGLIEFVHCCTGDQLRETSSGLLALGTALNAMAMKPPQGEP